MSSSRTTATTSSGTLPANLVIAAVTVLFVLFPVTLMSASAALGIEVDSLSKADQQCLYCHAFETLRKDLGNGEELSLHVGGDAFAKSVHRPFGCAGCHRGVELENHPVNKTINSRREYAAQASEICSQCHSDASLKKGPEHHQRVSNADGPACAECHEAHSIRKIGQWKAEVDETAYCLTCHGQGLDIAHRDGGPLSLFIDERSLRESVHLDHQCTDCHTGFSTEAHEVGEFASERERSISLAAVCGGCHEDKLEQYEGSIHATLVDEGNLAAPVCTDCHGSHSVSPKAAYETIAGVPCKKCHENVFNAYLESMHGQARSKAGHIDAPICADCHRAHDIGVASTGEQLRDACLGCHEDALRIHQGWLPNTALHFEAVSCPACHAPLARRKVDLRLYDSVAHTPLSDQGGPSGFENRARALDREGNGLDAIELWNLVREMHQEGAVLRGRMEVQTGVEAHQLAGKAEAIRNCVSCHRDGADPFEMVTISIVQPDGRSVRYSADKEVLSSAVSVDSVGGFYAIGGTRIKLLDILLLLGVLGGASVPIGHLTMRKLVRKKR